MKLAPFSSSVVGLRWLRGDFEYFYGRFLPVGFLLGTLIAGIGLAYIQVNISPVLAIAGILAIPLGILLILRPNIGMWLVIFAIPLEEFNKFGGGLSVLKLLSIVVFGAMIAHFLIYRRQDSLVRAPQNWFIGIFIFVVLLSSFVAVDASRTLNRTIKLVRVLSLYLVVINVVRSKRDLNYLLWAFLLGGFVSALYGLLDPAQQGQRIVGTLGQTNLFAVSMTPRIPIALCLLRLEKNGSKKMVLWVILGVISYALLLTGSRGGLLALGASLVLFVLTQENRATWFVIVTAIAAVGLFAMPLEMKQRVGLVEESSGQDLGNSTDRRKTYQIYGLQLWQQNPIFGIGLDGFAEAYASSDYRFLLKGEKRAAHNTYLEILVGTGVLGLIPFIALLGISLINAWKYSKLRSYDTYLAGIAGGLLAAQGGYFIGMMFGSRQYEKTLWLLIALAVVLQNLIGIAQNNDKQRLLTSNNVLFQDKI